MKNLGSFNEESIALFHEHFEGNTNFSESTEDFVDFARCQRPDGSFYGTSGQCRKGKETGAKTEEPKKAKGKGGVGPFPEGTPERARSARKAAVVNALKKAKLPTGPVAMKSAVARELRKDENYTKLKNEAKARETEAKAAKKNAQDVYAKYKKGEAKAGDVRTADAAMNKAYTQSERAYSAMRRAERDVERRILDQVNKVSNKAIREARNKEPIVGTDMGGKKRLGDGDISTSPRD